MSVATKTRSVVYTRAHTAVHLADVILGTFSEIVARLGLGSRYLMSHFETIERGLIVWIREGSLDRVYLECGPQSAPEAVFEIPIDYTISGAGDVEFVANRARLARVLVKLTNVPAGTSYRVVASHDGYHSPVDGWSETARADTSGMSSYNLGGIGAGPGASASLRQWSRR